MFFKPIYLIFLSVISGAVGQLLMKKAMKSVGLINAINFRLILRIMLNPLIIAGLFLYAIALFLWLIVLSKLELSYAAPLYSISYIFIAILSFIFLKESVTILRILGILIICLGVFVITKT